MSDNLPPDHNPRATDNPEEARWKCAVCDNEFEHWMAMLECPLKDCPGHIREFEPHEYNPEPYLEPTP